VGLTVDGRGCTRGVRGLLNGSVTDGGRRGGQVESIDDMSSLLKSGVAAVVIAESNSAKGQNLLVLVFI
jgi:hypothetical protein